MKLICDAGHQHELVPYGWDGEANYLKMGCRTTRQYIEVHAFNAGDADPAWLDGTELAN